MQVSKFETMYKVKDFRQLLGHIVEVVAAVTQQETFHTIILNSMVEKIIFRNILRINGTLDNHLPTHGSSVYNLNQIHKILLGLEAANKLGVIWGAESGGEVIFF